MGLTTSAELERRLRRFARSLRSRGLDAAIVFARPNAYYLTGFDASLSYLLVTRDSSRLLVDGRYVEAARASVAHCEVELFKTLRKSLKKWWREFKPRRIGLEGSIPWLQWREFEEILPAVEWSDAEDLLLKLRAIKSREEIVRIAASARLNDAVYEAALGHAVPGASEIDVRNAVRVEADRLGADGLSFETIVASGASGSRPHYVPGDRRLRRGDLLLIDMGMIAHGYCSDMTRVVALGKSPRARLRKAFDAVLAAQVAALEAVAPGVPCARLHQIAAARLARRGFARYFTHGLGHGVGLEVHEGPRLNASSTDVLRPGMVITIEPGVYLPRLGGVRIEDLVLVTRSGARVLSKSRKSFRVLPFEG